MESLSTEVLPVNLIKFGLAICVIALLSNCQNEESELAVSGSSNQIVIGHVEQLYSAILDEDRDIWISLPSSMQISTNNELRYPVLVLLDGSTNFHSMTGVIEQFATSVGNGDLPEMIVVGIPNTDRMRDLTPTNVSGTSGGGDNFLDFIELELIPYIEENYPASSHRTLIGHSLGGLMVVDALASRPHIFNYYVAIDPSLWWDEQIVLQRAESALPERNYAGKALYLAVANTMEEGVTLGNVMKTTGESTIHIRSILQFAEMAEHITGNGLNFRWKYYGDESHSFVPLIAEYDAMRYLFSWYQLDGLGPLLTSESTITAADLVGLIDSHYANVSNQFGYKFMPPEIFINNVGRALLSSSKFPHAFEIFSSNLNNYPDSSITNTSMADYYNSQSDVSNARMYYSRAIELGAGPNIEKKLADLDSNRRSP